MMNSRCPVVLNSTDLTIHDTTTASSLKAFIDWCLDEIVSQNHDTEASLQLWQLAHSVQRSLSPESLVEGRDAAAGLQPPQRRAIAQMTDPSFKLAAC